ncbi:YaiI/YqxD family protein [Roseococcus sp. SDR]|uniref:YaiI/YqxD family protein n=1 Tax=Roseococcus sp. SDR TaxID=2835532 RepID=UPI001BCEF99C|nr:YaiI/YqxD family protein [Roseococcus sp. SDR]MBV1845326.1 YaiI/YqxD family protein [Roseococcus sp. SDR]
MTALYIDADACPVREEAFRVAARLQVHTHVVSNGARGILLPESPLIHRVIVTEGADVADDWIAERITAQDVCVTQDIPLAARCLEKGARALNAKGHRWTTENIGNALAGRAVAEHLRSTGARTGGPAGMTQQDRSRFLSELDTLLRAAMRPEPPRMRVPPGGF